jgi:tetratricopeptide (TPR) repeat protein
MPAYKSRWGEVAQQLRPVIAAHPEFLPAQALYGRAVVQQGEHEAIADWAENLPAEMEDQPQYWLAAGIWAEEQNDLKRAAHAYWRAVRLNENDSEALNRLSSTLAQLGRGEQAKAAAARAAMIADIRKHVDSLETWRQNSQSAAVQIALLLDQLGRPWEATTWLQAAFQMTDHKDPKLADVYKTIRNQLTGTTPWQAPEKLVAANIDLGDFPVVDWRQLDNDSPSEKANTSTSEFQLADQASLRNLNHLCKLRKPAGEEAGLAIYQSGAGGAGVIDFDLDGWPDVYLTVMDGTPKKSDSGQNRLYRNQGGRFTEITTAADAIDRGFAQGIAVGDYNADGLADLFVANVGGNRLFRNNGDGTFSDATAAASLTGDWWTTSAAIADINGDGHADLLEIGYCSGEEPYRRECIDLHLGQPRSCAPLAFDAERDRIWRGNGNGTFTDVTDSWFAAHEPGRGFGVVVGNLDHDNGLDIYVANDMTANHFWSADSSQSPFRLAEQATVRGLAFNERSLPQASMGIAAADADADGDIDFLLTHFFDDHNTFYEQVSRGMWADRSSRVGLAAPSHRMLGYGTQWIDLENDGTPELFIANGDIDDFGYQERPFRQPVQLFDRGPDGRWYEPNRGQLGDYFSKDRLARAVVTLDANRDGKTDLLVTHLFDPVALLINQTESESKQVRFFLRGTQSQRDAVGTQVQLLAGHRQYTQQQLAGDGFQCSNERCLTFGVGGADQVDEVTVIWPDGSSQELGGLASGRDYLIIQGSAKVFALAAAPPEFD